MKMLGMGIGTPSYPLFIGATLKRASLRTPQSAKITAIVVARMLPLRPTRNAAGAAPNEIASASESRSWPSLVLPFVRRATLPSRKSKTIAVRMQQIATSYFSWIVK